MLHYTMSRTAACLGFVACLLFAAGSPASADEPAPFADEPALETSQPSAAAESSAPPSASTISPAAQLKLEGRRAPIIFDRQLLLSQRDDAAARTGKPISTASAPIWGERKSYAIPAGEILVFDTLLNLFDRAYYGCCEYDSDLNSIKHNLRNGFHTDSDSFTVNQLGHPYQGSMYFGFARASGLNFWEGFAYAFVGSAFWEIAGETTRPSTNDQINTPIGGTFLGEALFRMANLWLERAPVSSTWKEIGAAAISPPLGFNRLAFGNRFKGLYPSNDPEYYSRLAVGVSQATQNNPGSTTEVKRTEGIVDFALDYGLPGRTGYVYRRPFDYFTFQASASSAIGFETVMTKGLLFGTDYGAKSKTVRGIWGLYGSYDYIAPQIFRLASSAVSLGTTLEWRPTPLLAVQGSLLGGAGYATVSTVNGIFDEHANHYGIAPQAALTGRVIVGDRVSLDFSGREYFVSDVSGGNRGGHDNVVRADTTLTWRIAGQHAVAVKYQYSRRDAEFPDLGDRKQHRATIGIFYTLLGRDRFGTGDWR